MAVGELAMPLSSWGEPWGAVVEAASHTDNLVLCFGVCIRISTSETDDRQDFQSHSRS